MWKLNLIFRQPAVLIVSTVVASWLAMQAVHEAGHVLFAWIMGGRVLRVVWHPLTISRTDVVDSISPWWVTAGGFLVGVVGPLAVWLVLSWLRWRGAFVVRFFAGFCLVANGAYMVGGTIADIGDAAVMLRLGTPAWAMVIGGAAAVAGGLFVWHGQGRDFGLAPGPSDVDAAVGMVVFAAAVTLVGVGLLLDLR